MTTKISIEREYRFSEAELKKILHLKGTVQHLHFDTHGIIITTSEVFAEQYGYLNSNQKRALQRETTGSKS